ncbi:MAG: V-type ATP synthase subunit E family protein [Candidatus Bathyarchaeia archaeon]
MSITNFATHIEKETKSEIEEIRRKAENEANQIVEESKKKAQDIIKEQKHKMTQEKFIRERSELAIIRMKQNTELVKTKSEWLDRAFDEAQKKLFELLKDTNSPTYKKFLNDIIVEGIVSMKGSKLIIQSDQKTNDLLKKNSATITKSASKVKGDNIDLKFEQNPGIRIGVIIQSDDKRQYYNNTLEARLTGTRESFSGDVYTLLFEGVD